MQFLILAVLASVSVSILLKVARRQGFAISHAIAINYVVATVCCWLFLRPSFANSEVLVANWPIFATLGVLLPSVFIIMGKAVANVGIVKSDAAQRLSLFLPILAAFTLFGEPLTGIKLTGIVLAFIALCALVYGGKSGSGSGTNLLRSALLLFGVWTGYGVIDILFKQMAKTGAGFSAILFVSFVLAGICMFIYLAIKGQRWSARDLIAGIILGGLNFANILFYIRAHQAMKEDPSLVFAGMNLGVICLGTLVGAVLFRERVRAINAIGIALAIAAIVVLFYGQTLLSAFN
ncbi:EamA/RhaT family transporter [Cardiobacteriaceae bacterium TAE3-ERU3]|nr:EamA/RhaT family transporter [Cardiobacteriaceae bacterium TAE3-ERU3]